MKSLILVRGLPGSGKTTIAKSLGGFHVETDMFWGDPYKFDMTRIKEAHQWCQDTAKKAFNLYDKVIVSNTFTTAFEMLPYFDIAKELGIKPQMVLCQGQFGNIHNVPNDVLAKMAARFEYNVDHLWSRLV